MLACLQVRAADGFAGSTDQWYCFDDVNVDPWDVSSMDKDCFGGKYTLDLQHYKGGPQVHSPIPVSTIVSSQPVHLPLHLHRCLISLASKM